MIICFNCQLEVKKVLDELIDHEQYRDYAEVISAAVLNLAVLQEELSSKGALVIGSDKSQSSEASIRSIKDEEGRRESSQLSGYLTDREASGVTTLQVGRQVSIPELFRLDHVGEPQALAGLPEDNRSVGEEIPLDHWIFGQYNKLLPAKVSVRALRHLSDGQRNGLVLGDAASKIAEEAAVLGDFLTHHDKRNQIRRDDALATAFPSTGPDAEKGRLRYASHFVGRTNKQGRMLGLLIDLKLVDHTRGKNPRLMLTEVGLRFASLKNPILDNAQDKPTHKFTLEETSLLLEHITSSVPVENFAYRAVLSAIAEGANTPNEIDAVLRSYLAQDSDAHLSKSFLATQRSGAISRMADLGLVSRARSGVKVSYVITKAGQDFMGIEI